jgi:hypothetical protein
LSQNVTVIFSCPELFREAILPSRRQLQRFGPKGPWLIPCTRLDPVLIRLTRKLAEQLNGLDLRPFTVGQLIDIADPLARMLVAEEWAEEVTPLHTRAVAADRSRRVPSAKSAKRTAR